MTHCQHSITKIVSRVQICDAVHVDQPADETVDHVLQCASPPREQFHDEQRTALTPCYITFFERICINGSQQKHSPSQQSYLQYCFQQMSVGCYVRRTKLMAANLQRQDQY